MVPSSSRIFLLLEERLVTSSVLASPDFSQVFTLSCNVSDVGIGTVLSQNVDGSEKVVAYASRTLSSSERKYSVIERELLVIVFGVNKYRGYLEGTHFNIVTDHSSLQWLSKLKSPSPRIAGYNAILSQCQYTIKYRKGSLNVIPDALSRIPQDTEIGLVEISDESLDEWYKDMIANITEKPGKYDQW